LWADYEEKFAKVGVDIVYLPYTGHISSTMLRKTLQTL
jgi:glycerol-3-phosphate cytidylyltransferase